MEVMRGRKNQEANILWTYLKTNMSTVMVQLTKWTYTLPDNMSAMTTYEMEIRTSKE